MKELDELLKKVEELSDFAHKIKLLTNLEPKEFLCQLTKYGLANEPQKVKVKQYVADWFEEHKDFLELSLGRITPDIRTKIVQGQALSEFEKWVNSTQNEPFETIIRMKNGYEVDEERKYYIRLTIPSSSVIGLYLGFNKDGKFDTSYGKPHITWGWKCRFTEKEIKAIDERYWPFAVPVEKVEV